MTQLQTEQQRRAAITAVAGKYARFSSLGYSSASVRAERQADLERDTEFERAHFDKSSSEKGSGEKSGA